jgi:hypothetical protein
MHLVYNSSTIHLLYTGAPGGSMSYTSLSPIRHGFAPGFVNYQLLAHGRWFSPGTPSSSTTKTGCHDKAEILLKVALKHQKSNQSNQIIYCIILVLYIDYTILVLYIYCTILVLYIYCTIPVLYIYCIILVLYIYCIILVLLF